MRGHFFRCVLLVPIVGLCLSPQLPAAEIKLFAVKDLAAKWLAEHKGIDASSELNAVILELWTSDKKMAAVGRFEKAILQGRPLDPDKNALHIGLNYLNASDMKCSVVVPDMKDNMAPWMFTGSNGTIHSNGGHTTGLDFSAAPKFKVLGWVRCDLKFIADVDQFEDTKDKPSTARLTLRAVMNVSSKSSSSEYRFELGQYRITAGKDSQLRKLPKWVSK
jgi:hypothetical protein